MEDLERLLAAHSDEAGVLVVVDGVFSMEGDVAKLPEIVNLKNRYGARLMVDEAHGIGVLGARGAAHHFGVAAEADLLMGTFSKSFASTGGFVAGDEEVIYYIKHHARSFLFSASIPPAAAAAALKALEIMETEPECVERLWRNTDLWKQGLAKAGFDTGPTQSPIVPIIVGEDLLLGRFWRQLFDAGLFVNAAVAPAVEPGNALLRTSCIASHEEEHLYRGLEILDTVGRGLGVLD
jgi:7-keto-8-aminopelargonate synthetase-like enzyme